LNTKESLLESRGGKKYRQTKGERDLISSRIGRVVKTKGGRLGRRLLNRIPDERKGRAQKKKNKKKITERKKVKGSYVYTTRKYIQTRNEQNTS